jgi:DNA polymerase III epsilon subunit-like protein
MTTIAIDFETTGIPDWNARSHDPKQPHIVEMALIEYGDDGVEIGNQRVVVKPDRCTFRTVVLSHQSGQGPRSIKEIIEPILERGLRLSSVEGPVMRP